MFCICSIAVGDLQKEWKLNSWEYTQIANSCLKFFVVQDQNLRILHSEYHGCWCAEDPRIQGIRHHGVYYVEPDKLCPRR